LYLLRESDLIYRQEGLMRRTILRISMCVVVLLSMSGMVSGSLLPGDYDGDWKVDLEDFAIMASGWLTTYDTIDLSDMASQWMTDWSSSFVTTWDTNLGSGTTVTLALAGTVSAEID